MLESKRGMWGKIFAIVGIIILIVLIIVGVTAYQGYAVYKTAMSEKDNIQSNMQELAKGDCTKIPLIESSINKIKGKVVGACKNPIIRMALNKMDKVPIKCSNIGDLENQVNNSLAPIKEACGNQTRLTLPTPPMPPTPPAKS